MSVDNLLEASRADQRQQLRSLVHQEVRYRGHSYRVIDAMSDGDRFGLFLQETYPQGIAAVIIVSGDDLRGVQVP